MTLQKKGETVQKSDESSKDESTMPANFEFFDSSPKAKTVDADGARAQIGIEKYPWRALPIGKSFFIDAKLEPVKLQTIQSAASRWNKKLNRCFRVVKHDSGIEVARLPDKVITEFFDQSVGTK